MFISMNGDCKKINKITLLFNWFANESYRWLSCKDIEVEKHHYEMHLGQSVRPYPHTITGGWVINGQTTFSLAGAQEVRSESGTC